MKHLQIIFLFILSLCKISASSSSFNLVSDLGTCRSGTVLSKFVTTAAKTAALGLDTALPVIGVIDIGADPDCSTVNGIFKANFNPTSGVSLNIAGEKPPAIVLFCSFDSISSPKFCGIKAAEFCGAVADSICMVLPEVDLIESLIGHDQIFRTLFSKLKGTSSQRINLQFIVSTKNIDKSKIEETIKKYTEEVWLDVTEKKQEFSDSIVLSVILHDSEDKSSLKQAHAAIFDMDTSKVTSRPLGSLAEILPGLWSSAVSTGVPKSILKPAERAALFDIETAYTQGISQAESALRPWRTRVNNGKIIGQFGSRVQELITDLRESFHERTLGSLVVRERAARSEQLASYVKTSSAALLRQQLASLQNDALVSFRKSLVEICRGEEDYSKEKEQQAMRKVLYDFRLIMSELENESLGLSGNEILAELTSTLQTFSQEFPESPAARLEAVRKLERQAKKPRGKKEKGVNIGLNLVGMLRPPGSGTLQGFVGYSTGLFGLPLDLLLGVQNDGDSPEITGEDREHPILRLQPKMHFDINV